MTQKQSISVIIPTKDRPKDVIKCVESLVSQSLLPDEIIIVDASNDGQSLKSKVEALKFKGIKFIYVQTHPGLTYQRNIGINTSSGNIIIFLDDDVILDSDYIQQIMHVFNNDLEKKVGGVTGNDMLKKTRNSFKQVFGHYYRTIFFLFIYSNGKFRLSGRPSFVSNKVKKNIPVECLAGCNMAFRKEIFEEFRFDENLHGYAFMEDCDIAYRVSQKYQNMYAPFAKLVHNVSPISRDKEYDRLKMEIENHHYLFKKNFPQDFKHKFAFWWSVAGLFMRQSYDVIMRNRGGKEGLKGLLDGIMSIKRNKMVLNHRRLYPKMYQMDYLVLNALSKSLQKAIGRHEGVNLKVLDIGCGNKPYLSFFKDKSKTYVGIDSIHSEHVDCMASAEYLPVALETFDIVISTQVLEHVKNPLKVIQEMHRVLKKGGIAYLSAPGVWEKHEIPNDYWRWTDDGLKMIFDDFSTVKVVENGGAILCLFQLLNLYICKLPKMFKLIKMMLFAVNNLIGKYCDNQKYKWFVINYLVIAKK